MNNFTNLLAIHCHTTGMNFNNKDKTDGHQAISVALGILDLNSLKLIDTVQTFIKLDSNIKWNSDLEKIHGIVPEHLQEYGDTTAYAAGALGSFIAKHFGIDKKIPTFGYNVNNFHLQFLEKILHSEELYFNFDERSVDLYSITTLLDKFSVYDTIEALFGKHSGPISSYDFLTYYTKIYKMSKFLVKNSIGS